MTLPLLAALLALPLQTAVAPSPAATAESPGVSGVSGPSRRPNLLLIVADQLRGDALGVAGWSGAHTPNLDRLATDGVRFERAYSSTPSCTPARAALLTGRSPWGHGMLGYGRVAERYPEELPRLLAGAGYVTHAIGKNHFHPQRNTHGYANAELDESGRVESADFVSDYRRWFAEVAPELDPDATGLGWNDWRSGTYALPEALHPTTWTADRAVAFLAAADPEQPFLLKVSFARPHSPYDPPARFLELVGEPPPAAVGAWAVELHGDAAHPDDPTAARNALGPEATARSRRHYAASLAFVDEAVGRVLAALEEHGLADETLVLFTSDHGDMLGDQNLWRKTYAYEGSARVPLLVSWGAALAERDPALVRHTVRREPVELRDVLPTFLEAAGVPVPAAVEGQSLLALARDDAAGWRDVLDLEHATCYWPGNVWTALTDGRWKYVFLALDGREQLFDLDADPGELVDLAPDPTQADELARWRARMAEHLAPRGPEWTRDGRPAIRREALLYGPDYPR